MRQLLAELQQSLEHSRACVYCAVVETRGSTPQKAGAAMLVFADGTQTGTLGGGCVEAEVKQQALRTLHEVGDSARVLTFCLDDNYGWDDGLICGGRMTILADPLQPRIDQVAPYYATYQTLIESGQGCTEVIAVADNTAGVPIGQRYLFDAQNQCAAKLATVDLPASVVERIAGVTSRPRPSLHQGFAFLPSLPRITLLIVGGGHVGQAVAELATTVDFDVWVLDDRERYAGLDRFPTAIRHIVGDIGQSLKQLARSEIHPGVYCLIVTRGHSHDEEALYHLATTSAGYVGMIGSKRKIRLIYEDLIAKGIPEEALAKVHAPLGVSIGSQTVPEIAISIVAELIAMRNLGKSPR